MVNIQESTTRQSRLDHSRAFREATWYEHFYDKWMQSLQYQEACYLLQSRMSEQIKNISQEYQDRECVLVYLVKICNAMTSLLRSYQY